MATAQWKTLEELKIAGSLWTSKNLSRCDPYLVWADAVTSEASSGLDIAVLVELKEGVDGHLAFLKPMSLGSAALSGPSFVPNGFEPAGLSRFITGFVNRAALDLLVQLVVDGVIERFSIQNSREEIATATQKRWELAAQSMQPRNMFEVLCTTAAGSGTPNAAAHGGTYLGIIDDGLPFLRLPGLGSGPKAHLWDQGWRRPYLPNTQPGTPPGAGNPYWDVAWELAPGMPKPRGFLYGRRLKVPPTLGNARKGNDRDDYFAGDYGTPSPRKTHGAGVLGLMAPWLSGARGPADWPRHVSGLAMVQLPTSTVQDTSGGSLAMRVLDGLRYVLWQEERDRNGHPQERPVVVNISYGVHAGPHDGSSMFERALEEMLERHRKLEIVLPVGNAAQAQCHARLKFEAPGDSRSMDLEVLPDNGRDTFVELWLPKDAKVKLGIRPPGASAAFDVVQGEARIHFDPDAAGSMGAVHFGAVYADEVAQGTEGAMVLLAIGPTRRTHRPECSRALNQQTRRECLASPGVWQLTVTLLEGNAGTVDAWIERDDAPPDRAVGSRQARFLDASPEGTMNGIATLKHERLHVVGAMQVDGALSRYSAAGPDRLEGFQDGPEQVAPADWSSGLPGLRTTGFLRGAVTRINGTSAACAVYTRWLAEHPRTVQSGPVQAPALQSSPRPLPAAMDRKKQAAAKLRGQDRRGRYDFEDDEVLSRLLPRPRP